jgi:AcrR family transcriptional regulator
MTKGAFYNAFGSKENFLLETLASFDKSNTERIVRVLSPAENIKAIDQLKQFYTYMLDFQPRVNFMGCMINNTMSELGALNEKAGIAANNGFENIINAIEPAVKQAQLDGDLNRETGSREMAAMLHTAFYGVLTRAKSLGDHSEGIKTMNLLFKLLSDK